MPEATVDSVTARRSLLGVLSASWVAQACYAVTVLGVADALASGPKTAAEIAKECDADPDALQRVLRALASAGLFEQTETGAFALVPMTSLLCSGSPNSARPTVIMLGEEVYRSFGALVHAVRTGQPAFDHVHGMPMYDYLAANPAVGEGFNAAMQSRSDLPAALIGRNLPGARTIVDVGGGSGGLLAGLLAGDDSLRGVLFDLPEAVRQAGPVFAAAGVADRVELVEGDFFREVPAGGDVYILSRCLHNWNDTRAAAILASVRRAMELGARLIVLEKTIPEGPGKSAAKLYDLLMLAMVEGRNRTEAEYRALMRAAGLNVTSVRALSDSEPDSERVIEAEAI